MNKQTKVKVKITMQRRMVQERALQSGREVTGGLGKGSVESGAS